MKRPALEAKDAARKRAHESSGAALLREPELADGAGVWRLARESGTLDANSPYAYLMWCDHFRGTSVVALVDGRLAGFVCGFRSPRRPDHLFVWQVAVAREARGQGLAGRMIRAVIARDSGIRWLEATVTPSNEASSRLFLSVAERLGCPCQLSPWAEAEDFPSDHHDGSPAHEPEISYLIGPIETKP